MNEDKFHHLDKRVAVMEERMNTIQANLDKTLQEFKTDAEKRDKEAAQRETRMLLAMAVMIGIATAIIGILIRLPVAS